MSNRKDFNLHLPVYKTEALGVKLLVQLQRRTLFSAQPARGASTRKIKKYRKDAIWPIIMNGCSTGMPPIHVRIATSATRVQNRNWVMGRKVRLRCLEVWRMGTTIRTRIDESNARTPPSLFGIERRMA